MDSKKIHVIINPASGQERPILNILNTAFNDAGCLWDMTLTEAEGDTSALARQAAESGVDVVAAYGGDDTITAVADGLRDTGVPMGILPGGTANVLALELGIPLDLAQATAILLADSERRCLDLGRVGDRCFSVRVSTGLLASMVIDAERDAKNRLGEFAYLLRGLEAALGERKNSLYKLDVDGLAVEVEGVASFIANSGNLSMRGVSFSPDVQVDDGLLDVLVIRRVDVPSIVSLIASAASLENVGEALPHWQGRRITVSVDPPHPAAIDGELLGETPVTAEVIPAAVEVIVPERVPVEPAGSQT